MRARCRRARPRSPQRPSRAGSGGIGWLLGRYGLAADNLISAEVVLASGQVVTASEEFHPELFWALRGGGGNLGVVTSLKFQLHPVADVLAGSVVYPATAAAAVIDRYRQLTASAADELTVNLTVVPASRDGDEPLLVIAFCHCGPAPTHRWHRCSATATPSRNPWSVFPTR